MNKLFELSERAIELTNIQYIRPQIELLKQEERLIGIKGSRGVGKTTLLLQFAKTQLQHQNKIYLSLDNPFFTKNDLFDFVDDFVKNGGEYLLIDEVRHQKDWSLLLKNIYDNFKGLKIIYTGSSLLYLIKGRADLSRRSITYTLPGLSLREYINITQNTEFPVLSLPEILKNHVNLAKQIIQQIKPIQHYNEYLQTGYYPFF